MFLSRSSTENRASENNSKHEIAVLLRGVTNALSGLKEVDKRVVSYRSKSIADSVERKERHDILIAHTRKRTKDMFKGNTRQQEDFVGELTAVLNQEFQEVSEHLIGSMGRIANKLRLRCPNSESVY
jgi:hypothetical protein